MNVWLGMVVLLTLVWSMKAGVRPGLTFHLLGATAFNLCFGPYLAFVGLCLVWFINKLNTRTAEVFTELMNELEQQERNK